MNHEPADDSVAYWNSTYGRRPGAAATSRPGHDPRSQDHPIPAARPSGRRSGDRPDAGPPPRVRNGAEALGHARHYLDAALVAAFGILCLVTAGSSNQPLLPIALGVFALGYAFHIAFLASSYTMPLFLYAGAAFYGLWLLYG